MIVTRKDLIRFLKEERVLYTSNSNIRKIFDYITQKPNIKIRKYIKYLRVSEYFYNNIKNPIKFLLYLFYRRKKNILGTKLGIEIAENCFDLGLHIYHAGNIVVHNKAQIGKNCILHGSNCIGNSGISEEAPIIGDNVRLGVGSKIIGNIELADGIIVGAGAVVVNSFSKKNSILVGVPAKDNKREDL